MPGMRPEDVYELTGVADPQLSPDGRQVAFVVWRVDREANEVRSAIWVAPVDGSAPPRQLTSGTGTDGTPRWSPDGRWLAFTSKREGAKAAQLYVLPTDGGEARQLTDLKEDVRDPVWSPDGTRLAFVSRVRDPAYEEEDERKRPPRRITRLQYKLDNEGWIVDRPKHLFVVPADGSREPVQLTFGDFEDDKPAWSPDGTKIAFSSARHEDWDLDSVEDIFVVSSVGGEPERVTSTDAGCSWPSWSPDGTRLAYYLYPGRYWEPRHTQVAVHDLGSGERRVLTADLDRNCLPYPPLREPVWDGEHLYFALEDGGNVPLYRVGADGAAPPEPVASGAWWLTGFDVRDGQVVHSLTTPTTLSELYAGDRKLTDVGSAFLQGRTLSAPERFTARAPDGAAVEAWVMRPAGFEEGKRYPALLNIHGGPFTQYGNKFFDEFQVYAGAGYVVIYSNPRGSSGYAEAWGRAIMGSGDGGGPGWGSVDYEDLMAVVDEAVKRFDFIDPDRLGVMGGSYGGYMTSWIVGHTDRFRAAISERSVNNFVSQWGSSDFGWGLKGYFGSFLFEDFEAWVRLSPSTYAPNIHTPLLILHSENDLRCAVEQAEHLFVTLRLLRRPVEFVRFPGEGHELSRSGSPVHRVQRFEVILDWWRRHLPVE